MSLHRESGVVEGGIQLYKTFQSYKNGQIGFTPKVIFSCKPQNVAKSIPNINIHLVGGFQPVGYLSPTYIRPDSTHALMDARQATETSHGESSQKRSGQ